MFNLLGGNEVKVKGTIFLSYAREDDEAFVKRLYKDLANDGFDVWWDRVSMPSRQLTFHQEIKDAIRQRDRLVYVAGPRAAISDYVRAEWKFALECDKPVIPILRTGDIDILPSELRLLHCDDFRDSARYRESLAKLVANLKRPEAPIGKLFAVPSLPPYFLGRQDILQRIKDAVQIDLQAPIVITGATSRVGVQGMGGIGKSVLAAAVARNREVRRAYPDGVIWVSFGQEPDVAQLMRDAARHLGDQGSFESVTVGKGVLRELLLNKAVLLVLDDVWKAADAEAFDILGSRCRALVTTRDAGILHTLHGELYPVDLFTEAEALSLLAAAVEQTPDQLPPEALEIVRECGCLPLAVALCGGMAKKRDGSWGAILQRLQRAHLEKIADRHSINEQHRSIWQAMQISVEALEPEDQERFAELSVFLTYQTIPESAAATLWALSGNLDVLDTEELLINLGERALIRLEKGVTTPDGRSALRFSLHDLLYDYAVRTAGDSRELHQTLLDGYRKHCPDGWHDGPDDGYFFRSICPHLVSASGNWDEVANLLCDLRFVEARCRVGEVFELQTDYRGALENLPEAQDSRKQEQERDARVRRYTREIIEYALAWSEARARHEFDSDNNLSQKSEEIPLPEIIPSVRRWTEEEIEADTRRIVENPTRLDRIRAFAQFVSSEEHSLGRFGSHPMFCIQQAYNVADSGPVALSAQKALELPRSQPLLLHTFESLPKFNPYPACLRTLQEGHSSYVNSVSVTPDGRSVVSGSNDKTLRVWDLETGRCIQILEGHSDSVNSVSLTPDGRRVVSGSNDKTLRVWDLATGHCIQVLEGHSDSVSAVSVTPDGRRAISGSWDKTLRVWDLDKGRYVHILKGHTSGVLTVGITPDGRKAVSGGWDQLLRVWDLEDGLCLKVLGEFSSSNRWPLGSVYSVSLTPDGRRLVSGGDDHTLIFWDLETSGRIQTFDYYGLEIGGVIRGIKTVEGFGPLKATSITSDGRWVVSGGDDTTLRVWDSETGLCIKTMEGHFSPIRALSLTPEGRRAVSVGYSGLRVWDIETGRCIRNLEQHSSVVCAVSVTSDGNRATSASWDETFRVWDLETKRCIRIMEGVGFNGSTMKVSMEGDRAISGCAFNDTVGVYDLDTGRCIKVLEGHTSSVNVLCWTRDGHRAVTVCQDKKLRIWDLETGCCIQTLKGHSDFVDTMFAEFVHTAIVTPDGRGILSGDRGNCFRLWDLVSGCCSQIMEGYGEKIHSFHVDLTPDGRKAVVACSDGTLRVWELASGKCIKTFLTNSFGSVSVTSDRGARAVTVSSDKLRIWDLETGHCLIVFSSILPLTCLSICQKQNLIMAGTQLGEVLFLVPRNVPFGPAIVTVLRFFGPPNSSLLRHTARCRCLRERVRTGARAHFSHRHPLLSGWLQTNLHVPIFPIVLFRILAFSRFVPIAPTPLRFKTHSLLGLMIMNRSFVAAWTVAAERRETNTRAQSTTLRLWLPFLTSRAVSTR